MSICLRASPTEVFEFHMHPHNLLKVAPPGVRVRIVDAPDRLRLGAEVSLETQFGSLAFDWKSRIVKLAPCEEFVDEQVEGPFRRWRHRHVFEAINEGEGVQLTDAVHYEVKFGVLAGLAATGMLRRYLVRMFRYRQERMAEIFGRVEEAEAS
ncbi:MAG: SRPBCC family protein [Armatimonadota bacterium]